MARVARVLGWVWIVLAWAVLLVSIVGLFIKEGFRSVQETFSPFNFINLIALIVLFGPGAVLFGVAKEIEKRNRS